NKVSISSTINGLSLADGQEILLRWSDPDHSGTDHGLAIDDFSVTANGAAGDSAPSVVSTTPASGATSVPVNSTISVTFSESVSATASAFSLECPVGTPKTFTQSASPATTITLTPSSNLPAGTTCTVRVTSTQISDTDTIDPPDNMDSDYTFSFTTAVPD